MLLKLLKPPRPLGDHVYLGPSSRELIDIFSPTQSLVVLDYLLHSGSENVILYCRENLYEIKTLREFQYIDDEGHDQGVNVRHKAADVVNLLSDMGRLFEERKVRSNMRDRMIGRNSADTDPGLDEPRPYRARQRPLPDGLDRVVDQEDEELQRAIEESKRSASQEPHTAEDEDLAKALKLSEEEEERRKRMVESNATALFTDSNQMCVQLGSSGNIAADNDYSVEQ